MMGYNHTMKINIPEAQFKRTFPPTLLNEWKRAFMRCLTKVLILHDRTNLAQVDPTKRNITRAVVQGIRVGVDMEFFSKVDKSLTYSKKFPKNWDSLITEESERILDEEELANKETL